ncbi:MAG: amino acid racemase [Candidatus Aerophobetes bacterium]|nr:amino acid racemase [Candidatus Aerophobetes bacterium]
MKKIGIIGGMGPEATVDLFHKIVKNTPVKEDQEHIHLIIDNYPQIPDRSLFLLGRGENPLPFLLKSGKLLQEDGVDALCMPCNTAHYFIEDLRKNLSIPFISIVESALKEIKNRFSAARRIGLLATTGTINGKVYHKVFEKEGYLIVTPDSSNEEILMDAIFGEKGIKAGIIQENTVLVKKVIEHLKGKEIDLIIVACTEIPLVLPYFKEDVPIIDATNCLAKEVVRFYFQK